MAQMISGKKNLLYLNQLINDIISGCAPEVPFDEYKLDDRNTKLKEHVVIAQFTLSNLNSQLKFLLKNKSQLSGYTYELISSCFHLCGEHSQSNFIWSNTECYSKANLCLKQLCSLFEASRLDDLFNMIDISKVLFSLCSKKLDKENWKKNPAAVECFMWILKCLKMPQLNSLLYILMPLPLKMFDDYNDSNINIALDAFEHIIENTPSAELSMSGHDKVLIKSFESRLLSSEYHMIPHVLKCLLFLISKLQLKHVTGKNDLEWNKFDDILSILLPRMELETKSEPIEKYATIFPLLIESIGFSGIRWSQRLIPLFAEYITYNHSKLKTVQTIKIFILQTWPRKNSDWKDLLSILIKALYDEDKCNLPPNEDNVTAIVDCIRLLKSAVPEETQNILYELKNVQELQTKKIFLEALNTI